MPAKKTAKKTLTPPKRLIVTAQGPNVREAPTLQAKVVHILGKGDIVDWISTSGDGYFHKISHKGTEDWASHKYLQFVTTPAPASNFPWFEIAHAEIGTREVTGSGDNPRIVAYHRSTNLDAPSASNNETPWRSSFVNWYVKRSGQAGTESAWACSWVNCPPDQRLHRRLHPGNRFPPSRLLHLENRHQNQNPRRQPKR